MTAQLFDKAGGYRKLHCFTYASLIHLGTISFCKRFIPWQKDSLGKTVGQMVGAARSGRQNIIEGSERSGTSKETEIKLLDVARASLAELLGDYEIFLAENGQIPWSINEPSYQQIMAIKLPGFQFTNDSMHDYWIYYHNIAPQFGFWLNSENSTVVANALIAIILRCMGMLDRLIKRLGKEFTQKGGFKERMYQVRSDARDGQDSNLESPACPQCGKPMRKRFPKNYSNHVKPFWGCSDFPNCKGIKNFSAPVK